MTTGCGSPAKQEHSEHFNRVVGQRRTRHTRPPSRPCPPHAAIVYAAAVVMTRSTSSLAGPTASCAVQGCVGWCRENAKRLTMTSPVCPAARDREMLRSKVGR